MDARAYPQRNGLASQGIKPNRTLVGRFAPSPTGRMHAGNILASLVAWILVKREGGKMLLRIEDLDAQRSRDEHAWQLMADFEALGLTWDEAPLWQHNRHEAYRDAYERVSSAAEVYPCFCTRADLHAASAPHAGEQSVYPGTCRKLEKNTVREKLDTLRASGRCASMRVHVPDKLVHFTDIFQGTQKFSLSRDCGDFVIRRVDESYSYHLAVVVDDAFSQVNVVVRGADLLASTAQQIFLQELLSLERPLYAHVPLLTAPDGRRIAKRDKDAGLPELASRYGSVQGVLGHIAFVAGLIEEDAPCTADELLACAHMDALVGQRSITWF